MVRMLAPLALVLTAVPAIAQTSALPPGKAAGVQDAQAVNYNGTAVGALVVILGVGLYFISTDYPATSTVSPEP